MPLPLLSIIIPTLNEALNLPRLLGDLDRQLEIPLEIIVGDGGSTDNTRKIAESFRVSVITGQTGRGAQMNAAAARASGEFLLFLHADSRIDDPHLLSRAVFSLLGAMENDGSRELAGHFRLRFIRATERNKMAYRYIEEKTAFNRAGTTNGDQGLLIRRAFFEDLGRYDDSLPFLEDQRMGDKIRSQGGWVTLPGSLLTSARRFEAEGFHRRYILMGMIMGLYSAGEYPFFTRAPDLYRTQQETGRLLLSPFFALVWNMICNDWGLWGSIRIFYLLGRYIRQNSWQSFFFLDVGFRPLLGNGRYPFLNFHDRIFAPCDDFKVFNLLAGIGCFILFMGILAPFYLAVDCKELDHGRCRV